MVLRYYDKSFSRSGGNDFAKSLPNGLIFMERSASEPNRSCLTAFVIQNRSTFFMGRCAKAWHSSTFHRVCVVLFFQTAPPNTNAQRYGYANSEGDIQRSRVMKKFFRGYELQRFSSTRFYSLCTNVKKILQGRYYALVQLRLVRPERCHAISTSAFKNRGHK